MNFYLLDPFNPDLLNDDAELSPLVESLLCSCYNSDFLQMWLHLLTLYSIFLRIPPSHCLLIPGLPVWPAAVCLQPGFSTGCQRFLCNVLFFCLNRKISVLFRLAHLHSLYQNTQSCDSFGKNCCDGVKLPNTELLHSGGTMSQCHDSFLPKQAPK